MIDSSPKSGIEVKKGGERHAQRAHNYLLFSLAPKKVSGKVPGGKGLQTLPLNVCAGNIM